MLHISPNGNGTEYDLQSLPIGGRFRVTNPYAAPQYGTLIEVGTGSCIVRLDRPRKHISIRTGTGEAIDFDSSRARTTRWSPHTPVEYLNEIVHDVHDTSAESQTDSAASNSTEEINQMATATARKAKSEPKSATTTKTATAKKAAVVPISTPAAAPAVLTPQAKALIARWKIAVAKLGQLLKIDGPVEATVNQREAVQGIYDEAVVAQVQLPSDPVTFADPVFKDMDLAPTAGFESGSASGTASNTTKTVTASPAKTGRKDGASKKAAAPAKAKSATPRKAKAPENDCLDGCGAKVRSNFKQGHDAKYRGLILSVERGDTKESELPSLMRRQGGKDGEPLTFRKLAGDKGLKCTNSVLKH